MKDDLNLKENYGTFIEKRLNEIYNNLNKSQKYTEVSNRYFEIFKTLKNELVNNQDLLEEYEEIQAFIHIMQLKQAYLTGFKDSNIILNKTIILE